MYHFVPFGPFLHSTFLRYDNRLEAFFREIVNCFDALGRRESRVGVDQLRGCVAGGALAPRGRGTKGGLRGVGGQRERLAGWTERESVEATSTHSLGRARIGGEYSRRVVCRVN